MSRRHLALVCLILLNLTRVAQADDNPVVQRGLAFLKSQASGLDSGEGAIAALALIKAETPATDPSLANLMGKLNARFTSPGTYSPGRSDGAGIYETGLTIMAYANLDSVAYKPQIEAAAKYLLSMQKAGGCWDYGHGEKGDTSISQYAVLGLWEAENAGVDIPPSTWDRAATWYLANQGAGGGWVYHPGEGGDENMSMTAAGTGSLLICQRQLNKYRKAGDAIHPLLIPLVAANVAGRFNPDVSNKRMNEGIQRGLGWLSRNFNPAGNATGPSVFYGLYGVERIGALADRDTLNGVDWYKVGERYISARQSGNGSWNSAHGETPNTAWCVLFLTKATAKTLAKIEINRLGAGTLLGGRGLPTDLSSLTIAQGRVVVRPMNGAVEGMLAVLEDPRAANADAALAGLVSRYQVEGPAALKPHKDRLSKLMSDPDQGVRRVACWGLARIAEMDVVPRLIVAIGDRDQSVVDEARVGLQLLSRKIDGFGPPSPATPDQKEKAARDWKAWYDGIRPLSAETADDLSGFDPPVRSKP